MTFHRLFRSLAHAGIVLAVACGGGDSTAPSPTPSPAVASVELTPPIATLTAGRTLGLSAVARTGAGQPVSTPFTWSSSSPAIVAVDAAGTVTALTPGQATITATATTAGKSAQSVITVVLAPAASVVVAPDSTLIRLSESATLAASVRDEQGGVLVGRTVRWRSSNAAVATVDSITGLVTAVDAGVTIVSATSETKTGSAKVVVHAPVATVSIEQSLDTLEAFDTLQVSAVLRDARSRVLAGRVVRWTSSNPAVASIDSVTGRLAGIDRGTVIVTATSEGKSGVASRVVVIRYRSIAAGTMHSCDIASGGIAWCWGLNGNEGRVGSGTLGVHANHTQPFAVPGGHRFMQLVTYARTTCGITRGAETYCWGYNGFGALGDGSSSGFSVTPVRVSGNRAFVKLAAGTDFACALDVVGAMYCWGYNGWGQFGNNTTAQSAIPVVAAPGMTFSAIAAGSTHVCGVAASGTYCWGADGQGQVGDGSAMSNGNTFTRVPKMIAGGQTFQSLALGNLFSCGRTSASQGYCWGNAANGVLGSNRSANTSTPAAIAGGLSFQSLSAGFAHVCGIAIGGSLYCWGANISGQLGAGTFAGSASPVRVEGFQAIEVAVAGIGTGSGAHSCAISADRLTVRCWGQNDDAQLGNGTTAPASVPNLSPSIVTGQRPL